MREKNKPPAEDGHTRWCSSGWCHPSCKLRPPTPPDLLAVVRERIKRVLDKYQPDSGLWRDLSKIEAHLDTLTPHRVRVVEAKITYGVEDELVVWADWEGAADGTPVKVLIEEDGR